MGGFDDLARGVPLTVQAAEQLLDTENLSPQQRRNLKRFIGDAEQRMQGHLNERIAAASADLQQRYDHLDDLVISLKEQTRKITAQLRRGRITAEEARKALAKIGAATRDLRERTAQLANDEAALKQLAAMTPSDYEADMLAKYPALRSRMPVLHPRDLNQP